MRIAGFSLLAVLVVLAGAVVAAQTVKPVCTIEQWRAEDVTCQGISEMGCGAFLILDSSGRGNIRWCNRATDSLYDHIGPQESSAEGSYIHDLDIDTATEFAGIMTEATGAGSFVRQIGPIMSNITLSDGTMVSSVAAGSASFDFENDTAKTSGQVGSFSDDGTLRLEVDSLGVVNADTNYIRTRTQRTGDFSVAGMTDHLNVGFPKTGKRAAVDPGGFDIMTDGNQPYAVGIGADNEIYCAANPVGDAWICYKRFNATLGGSYGDNTYMTGGFFSVAPGINLTATGTTCGTALVLAQQANEVRTVAFAANYAKAPECAGGTPEPPGGMLLTVLNTDAADTLFLCPPSGGDMGAGTDTAISVLAGQHALCSCYLQDTYDCQVG